MITNPNSPWRKKSTHTKVTAETSEQLSEKINELFSRGYTIVSQTEEEQTFITNSIITDSGHQRKFVGLKPKRYIAIMKRGN